MGRITTSLPDETERQIGNLAVDTGCSKSEWVAAACRAALDTRPADPTNLEAEIDRMTALLIDREAEVRWLRSLVDDVHMVRTRQEMIAQGTADALQLLGSGLDALNTDLKNLHLPAAELIEPGPVEQQKCLGLPHAFFHRVYDRLFGPEGA